MYRQITQGERYALAALRGQHHAVTVIAQQLGRHRSTIWREVHRNAARADGGYRPQLANWYARSRRSHSRRNRRFTLEHQALVAALLWEHWSPEQIAGWLRRHQILAISHETIYRWIWEDWHANGLLHTRLRGARRRRRKRYGTPERRGRVATKRSIADRPAIVDARRQVGHWEADTLLGAGRPCLLSMVERATGFVALGKLEARTAAALNPRAIAVLRRRVRSITADNGTEFHSYAAIERATAARFYFARPYHAWERGTNENTNGLLRQYWPKRCHFAAVSQQDCDAIAVRLNARPRKRLGYQTPEECYTPR